MSNETPTGKSFFGQGGAFRNVLSGFAPNLFPYKSHVDSTEAFLQKEDTKEKKSDWYNDNLYISPNGAVNRYQPETSSDEENNSRDASEYVKAFYDKAGELANIANGSDAELQRWAADKADFKQIIKLAGAAPEMFLGWNDGMLDDYLNSYISGGDEESFANDLLENRSDLESQLNDYRARTFDPSDEEQLLRYLGTNPDMFDEMLDYFEQEENSPLQYYNRTVKYAEDEDTLKQQQYNALYQQLIAQYIDQQLENEDLTALQLAGLMDLQDQVAKKAGISMRITETDDGKRNGELDVSKLEGYGDYYNADDYEYYDSYGRFYDLGTNANFFNQTSELVNRYNTAIGENNPHQAYITAANNGNDEQFNQLSRAYYNQKQSELTNRNY